MNRYHDIPARIERVKAHLKTRRGRRDFKAHVHLVRLQRVLEGAPTARLPDIDRILKNIYSDENCPPNRILLVHPTYAMIKKG